jgi:hypothetical protein
LSFVHAVAVAVIAAVMIAVMTAVVIVVEFFNGDILAMILITLYVGIHCILPLDLFSG